MQALGLYNCSYRENIKCDNFCVSRLNVAYLAFYVNLLIKRVINRCLKSKDYCQICYEKSANSEHASQKHIPFLFCSQSITFRHRLINEVFYEMC